MRDAHSCQPRQWAMIGREALAGVGRKLGLRKPTDTDCRKPYTASVQQVTLTNYSSLLHTLYVLPEFRE